MNVVYWLILGASTALANDAPAIVHSEFIFESAPFPICHASSIVQSNSELVAAWFGGTREGHPDVGIWVSRFANGHWSSPSEAANGKQPDGRQLACWNPVLFQPSTGPLLLFYKVGPNVRDWRGFFRTSSDGGATWSPASQLPNGFYGPTKNKPVQMVDGTILCPSSVEDNDGWRRGLTNTELVIRATIIALAGFFCWQIGCSVRRRNTDRLRDSWSRTHTLLLAGFLCFLAACLLMHFWGFWRPGRRVHLESTSEPHGQWRRIGPVASSGISAIQPTILTYPGRRLQILSRTKEGVIAESWSTDGGESWTPVAATSLPNNDSGIDGISLADGRQLLVYNHVAPAPTRPDAPRTPLNVAISTDGKTWKNVLTLESDPGEYSYPAVIQASDGSVHVTYTWNRQRIKHVVIDPTKLK